MLFHGKQILFSVVLVRRLKKKDTSKFTSALAIFSFKPRYQPRYLVRIGVSFTILSILVVDAKFSDMIYHFTKFIVKNLLEMDFYTLSYYGIFKWEPPGSGATEVKIFQLHFSLLQTLGRKNYYIFNTAAPTVLYCTWDTASRGREPLSTTTLP